MTTPWLVPVQAAARPVMRSICVPYAGVGVSAYRRRRGEFAPELEVLALQTPGRENRLSAAPFSRLEPLVTAATAAIRPYLDVPFAVFEGYRYQPLEPLACPLSALGGLRDAEATPADLVACRQQTRGAFTTRTFPGGHFFLQSAHADVVRGVAGDPTSSSVAGGRS